MPEPTALVARADWLPYGNFNASDDGPPLTATQGPPGHPILRLRVQPSAPLTDLVSAHRQSLRDELEALLLDTVRASPQYQRLQELRPAYLQAVTADWEASAALVEAQSQREGLLQQSPVPDNLAERLAHADQVLAEAQAHAEKRAREQESIEPIWQQARNAVSALALSQETPLRHRLQSLALERLQAKLTAFLAANADALTELAVLAEGRKHKVPVTVSRLAATLLEEAGA